MLDAHPPFEADHVSLEQVETLEELGLMLSPPINGKRKVSLDAFTTPPPRIPDPPSTSRPSATFHHHYFTPSHQATIDLPIAPWSVASLEFLGFTPATSHEILAHFLDRPDPEINCYDLIDHAESPVQSKDPRQKSLLPPRELMTRMGLDAAMQDALRDPRFAGVAGTETLQFWILHTLRVNYDALVRLQDGLWDVAIAAAAGEGEEEGEQAGGGDEDNEDEDDEDDEDDDEDDEDDECDEDDDHDATSAADASSIDADADASTISFTDHTTLYAASTTPPIDTFLSRHKPGGVGLHNVARTRPGGDFNGVRSASAWTWTPQAATAELYRGWMARRCAWAATWVVSMRVPKGVIDGMGTEEVWWGGEEGKKWEGFVVVCRGMGQWGDGEMEEGVELVKGNVSTRVAECVRRGGDVADVGEDMVLRLGSGELCRHWVFLGSETLGWIEKAARGAFHVDVRPAAGMQGSEEVEYGWRQALCLVLLFLAELITLFGWNRL